jgi:hypothetical protein
MPHVIPLSGELSGLGLSGSAIRMKRGTREQLLTSCSALISPIIVGLFPPLLPRLPRGSSPEFPGKDNPVGMLDLRQRIEKGGPDFENYDIFR